MHILIIKDDKLPPDSLKMELEQQSFLVDTTENRVTGLSLVMKNEYNIIILDGTLPGQSEYDLCEEIRMNGKNSYIIILSATTEASTRIELLNRGADDCILKPYSFEELLARIQVLLRRPKMVETKSLSYGDLCLNVQAHTVARGAKEIKLTKKEFMMLEHLLHYQGKIVSRATFIDHIWSSSVDALSNTVESHISSLRRKIDRKYRMSLIQTVSGKGYKIG